MEKLGSSLISHGDLKIGEYQNSNLCFSSIPDCSLVVSLLFHSNINEGGAWIRNIPSLHAVIISNYVLKTTYQLRGMASTLRMHTTI